jgi:hypothetical protein
VLGVLHEPPAARGPTMAEKSIFDWVCDELEEATSLNRIETRGTVRLALKQAGLEVHGLTREQMQVVLRKLMPGELTSRSVEAADQICQQIQAGLRNAQLAESVGADGPDTIFSRLGGSR